jgi:hypothetical protein
MITISFAFPSLRGLTAVAQWQSSKSLGKYVSFSVLFLPRYLLSTPGREMILLSVSPVLWPLADGATFALTTFAGMLLYGNGVVVYVQPTMPDDRDHSTDIAHPPLEYGLNLFITFAKAEDLRIFLESYVLEGQERLVQRRGCGDDQA